MKKILTLVVALAGVAGIANAQIQKGNVLVGGDIANFNLGLNKGGKFSARLNPKAAWFINNNIAVGAQVVFGIETAKDAGNTIDYAVGPIARYYINDPKVNLLQHGRWFFEGNAGFGGTNIKGGNSTNGLNLGVGPGYAYFITPNVGLETLLKYDGIVGFGNTTSANNLVLNLGFQIYLPGKATRDKIMREERK